MDELAQNKVAVDNLMIGDPQFKTPDFILKAGKRALDRDLTFYLRDDGCLSLKKEAKRFYQRTFGQTYPLDQIAITTGAVNGIFLAIQLLCNPGDEVIVFAPHYLSYPAQIKMAGGVYTLVHNKKEEDYHLNLEEFKKAIRPRTKAVIVNTPCNPTGAVYDVDELRELVAIAKRHNLWIISDEVYGTIVYNGKQHVSPATVGQEAFERTIVISSLSKLFGMTGWRIGVTMGPRDFMHQYCNAIKYCTSCSSSISQYAATTAFRKSGVVIDYYYEKYSKNREILFQTLIQGSRCRFTKPQGAFYTLVDVKPYLGKVLDGAKIDTALDFALQLLQRKHVAVLSGDDFSAKDCIRLSFVTTPESVRHGCHKLIDFMEELARAPAVAKVA